MVPVSTVYAAIIELVSLLVAVALFTTLGLTTGWAVFCAVILLTAAWGATAWLADKHLADSILHRAITKVFLLNAAAVAISPFIPLARWLHDTIGLSKPWAGSVACLLAVVTLFAVLGFISLRGKKPKKPPPT